MATDDDTAAPDTTGATSPDRGWLDHQQQRSWRAYLVGTTLLMDRLDRELRERHRISLPEYEILVRLSEAERNRMRMAELADSVSHSRSRVTHTVSRMEAAGLVARDACLSDGRGVEAVLTDEGRATLEAAAPVHVAGVRTHFVDHLTRSQLRQLGAAFEALRRGRGLEAPSPESLERA